MTKQGAPTSTRPYLLRAVYEWCVDNGLTPQVLVLVDAQTRVPKEFVSDGKIVLNIGPEATSRLKMGNETIECSARFSGVARELVIPVEAVGAIYARETGQGLSFEGAEGKGDVGSKEAAEPAPSDPLKPGGKPALKRVK